jgi:hypothetical protein
MEETPSAKTRLGWGVAILGGLALLAALVLALWHVVEWLRDGIWPQYAAAALLADLGIARPVLPWPWAEGAIGWILAWSAAGVLTCSGILLLLAGSLLSAEYDHQIALSKAARERLLPAGGAERTASSAPGGKVKTTTVTKTMAKTLKPALPPRIANMRRCWRPIQFRLRQASGGRYPMQCLAAAASV